MQEANTLVGIYRNRGERGLPLERVYRHLFNPNLYQLAYAHISQNKGAMTKGVTDETVDGMSIDKVQHIIDLLKQERYKWNPVRRVHIPKRNGKTRALGLPTWSDKLVQEAIRLLLEAYYEPLFRDCSHGFRPKRSPHTALSHIKQWWNGTTWFIEGDISKCFDMINHKILLEILSQRIKDGRLLNLIKGMLEAGCMEQGQLRQTQSGTPQGGVISPLLANIYLHELDKYTEDNLIPEYTRGNRRRNSTAAVSEYVRLTAAIQGARRHRDFKRAKQLAAQRERTTDTRLDMLDPNFRRLRYVRYADDFLLGFTGPKSEAEEIVGKLSAFLDTELKLSLSKEKTLVTHATSEYARFLGHHVRRMRGRTGNRKGRAFLQLYVPYISSDLRKHFSFTNGTIQHRTDWTDLDEYTIVNRYQVLLRGLYNYYCLGINVGKEMARVHYILLYSMLKTLAHKRRCTMGKVFRSTKTFVNGYRAHKVCRVRQNQPPLVATFGGFSLARRTLPPASAAKDFDLREVMHHGQTERSEAYHRLLYTECAICGAPAKVEMHHIRKLADAIGKAEWQKVMMARRRKAIPICEKCHRRIHSGKHDGPRLSELLESRMP